MVTREIAAARYSRSAFFSVLVFMVCALYPNEGFLMMAHPQAAKLTPAVLLLSWGIWCLRERRRPVFTPIMMTLLLLGCVVLASMAINYRGDNTNALVMLIRWVPYLIITAALSDLMATRVDPAVGLGGLATGAVVAGGGALYSFLVLGIPRAAGPMDDPNDLACILVASLSPLLLLGGSHKSRVVRIAAMVGAVVCVGGALATASRGGILAATAMVIWAFSQRLIRPRHVVVAGIVGALGVTAALTFAKPAVDNALNQKKYIAGRNIETRELRWNAALMEMADHPLLGVGPGGNPFHYMAYSNRAELDDRKPVTHDMYIEVGSELGLLGAACFFYLIFRTLFGLSAVGPPYRRTALATQGLLLGVCVASAFLSEEYYLQVWLNFAVYGALWYRQGLDLPTATPQFTRPYHHTEVPS